MKVLLVAINAKYIHSNLAVYSLKAYAEKYGLNKHQIKIKEYTINQYPEEILSDIYSEKADVVGFSCYIWNIALTKEVINDLKVVAPKTIVIVGGPGGFLQSKKCAYGKSGNRLRYVSGRGGVF